MSLYQESAKNSPGVKFGPALGVTTFTWNYVEKTLNISLYLAIRPRLAKFCMYSYLVILYQESQKKLPLGQIWPRPLGHNFYMELYRENFRNVPVPSFKA